MAKSTKIFIPFIFLLLIISCEDKKSESQTSEFDKVLGSENVATLNFLVSDFENDFLKRQYPNLKTEDAYRKFLTELRDKKTENRKSISENARKKFKASDLRLEMYEFPDSVWILKNSTFDKIESDSLLFLDSSIPYVKSRYKYTNPDGTTEYNYSRSYGGNIEEIDYDSIINREMKSPSFNGIGKYIQALYQIKERDTFFKNFYKQKEYGFIRAETLAKVMLEENVDLNDYLVKRIIVLEIAY
jgi:hypothetical protein